MINNFVKIHCLEDVKTVEFWAVPFYGEQRFKPVQYNFSKDSYILNTYTLFVLPFFLCMAKALNFTTFGGK